MSTYQTATEAAAEAWGLKHIALRLALAIEEGRRS